MIASLIAVLLASQGGPSPDLVNLGRAVARNDARAVAAGLAAHSFESGDRQQAHPGSRGRKLLAGWLRDAIRKEDIQVAQLLLDAGADPNGADSNGRTPLFFARTTRTVRLLTDRGADATHTDRHGRSTLAGISCLSRFEAAAAARELIRQGAVPCLPDAIGLGDVQMVREILGGRAGEKVPLAMLVFALRVGSTDAAHALLDHGVRKNAEGESYARVSGEPQVFNSTVDPESAFAAAMQTGQLDVAARLLELRLTGFERSELPEKPYRSSSDTFQGDLLGRAIHLGNLALTASLLDAGVALDRAGDSVCGDGDLSGRRLLRAAWRGHAPVIQLLLQRGAKIECEDPRLSPTLVAGLGGNGDAYLELLRGGAARSLFAEVILGHTDQVALMLDRDPSLLNARDPRLRLPPLAWAILGGHGDMTKLLLARGADPNSVDQLEWGTHAYRDTRGEIPSFPMGNSSTKSILHFALADAHHAWAAPERWASGMATVRALVEHGAVPDSPSVASLAMVPGGDATALLERLLENAHRRRPVAQSDVMRRRRDDWWSHAFVLLSHLSTGDPLPQPSTKERVARVGVMLAAGARLVTPRGASVVQGRRLLPFVPEVVQLLKDAGAEVPSGVAIRLGWEERPAPTLSGLEDLSDEAARTLFHEGLFLDQSTLVAALVDLHPDWLPEVIEETIATRIPKLSLWLLDEKRIPLNWSRYEDPSLLTAWAWSPILVQRLLTLGLEADLTGQYASPLHSASAARCPDSIRALIQAGADPNVRNGNGETPLEHALLQSHRAPDGDLVATVRTLLQLGADPLQVPRTADSLIRVIDTTAHTPEELRALHTLLSPMQPIDPPR